MILALETATEVCSAALLTKNGTHYEKREAAKGVHSEKLFQFIKQLFQDHRCTVADLDHLLISRGPGQYTGLRIGAAGAKGILFGSSIPLFSIGTLEGFAAGAAITGGVTGTVHAVVDARRKHLYHQKFDIQSDSADAGRADVLEITEIDNLLEDGLTVVGTGLNRLESAGNSKIRWLGPDFISAVNLIHAWQDERFRSFFKKEEPSSFEPDYLTSGQGS